MRNFTNKLAFITGAGSGIGRETALAFAREGAKIIVADINDAGAAETVRLVAAQGGVAVAMHLDVTDACAVQAAAGRVGQEHGVVDILVNNAGIGSAGRFLDTRLETWRKVVDVNLMGVVHGCHAFLPDMVSRGAGGHVVNLSSLAGYFAAPDMPVYAASKFAVHGFSEALRADMAEHGIGVTAICPGIIDTPIIAASIMEGDMDDHSVRERVQALYRRRRYTPDRVAAAIVDAVRRNQAVRPVSPESWALYFGKRLLPGLTAFAARNQRRLTGG